MTNTNTALTTTALTTDIEKRTKKSQHFFNPILLSIYDFFLFNFISPYLWGCNKKQLINRYRLLCSDKHLEVGVGTGYLLDRVSPAIRHLALMDLNINCLEKSQKRLKRYAPTLWRQNILLPIENIDERFNSISVNYVMHCVAGSYKTKGVAFGHLKSLLNENGILFGASVIKTNDSSYPARLLMNLLNALGVFNNSGDTVKDLTSSLQSQFRFSTIIYQDSSVLFIATDSEQQFRSIEANNYGIS